MWNKSNIPVQNISINSKTQEELSENTFNVLNYVIWIILLIFFSVLIIANYYKWNLHSESWSLSTYLNYAIPFYFFYKIIKTLLSKDKVNFSPIWIFGYSLVSIFIASTIFFASSKWISGTGVLFWKILWYSLLPFLITIINYSFAKKLLNYIPSFSKEETPFRFLMSLWFWFTLFFTLLTIFASIWQYNTTTLYLILWTFIIISYKELLESFVQLLTFKISFDNHKLNWNIWELVNLNLLSAEFSFLALSFLIWVSLVSVVRPMPIWWDDLGVYMNFPQIMANSWTILKWAWMIAWQLLTWIWFMFKSAPQAFFLNQIGWILSVIVIIVASSDLLKTQSKRHLSIPIILATMFYSMPMIIFEQAKDMKLDPGLFFVSTIWLYLIYKLFVRYLWYEDITTKNEKQEIEEDFLIQKWKSNNFEIITSKIVSVFKSNNWENKIFNNTDYLIYILVIWSIVWLAFVIKVTSLMLILWIIWVIFYSLLWLSWFLWYFSIFISSFTYLRLWWMMNVNYPSSNIDWINWVTIIFGLIWITLLIYSYFKYKQESFIKALSLIIIFCLWVFTTLLPWFIKNFSELKVPTISIWALLNWQSSTFVADYSKIYTKEELVEINNKNKYEAISSSGKTTNEDLGRYFWYEDWINNYLKLPWNLTFQRNQAWEFTDITYFYLALIPIIFIFLAFRKPIFILGIPIFIFISFQYFSQANFWLILSSFFSKQVLPNWYLYILWVFLLPLFYILYSLKNDKLSQIFKLNFVFYTMYGFIFVIAAYGIVWYWILMYFSMLLMIWISIAYLSQQKENEWEDLFRLIGSIIVLFIISVYFFKSSLPHWVSNLPASSFTDFKAWILNQEEWIFQSHPDYFWMLSNLNIEDNKKLVADSMSMIQDETLKKIISQSLWQNFDISKLESILKEVKTSNLSSLIQNPEIINSVKIESAKTLDYIYKEVLYPSKDNQNNGKIYRIGTFLTYFISNNRDRYFEDNLIMSFMKYFYDKNPDVTIDRMKKIWLKFLLVDLNAATIDKDPRHDLTDRFEALLSTMKSDKLELIQTDSICLQIAIEEKNSNFLDIAWVNYESYSGSTTINRWVKLRECYNRILQLINQNKITDKNYSYLKPLTAYLTKNKITDQDQLVQIFKQYVNHWWMALFKIK